MSAPLDRERLAKLLVLFSSVHDGEVVAAARHADTLVKRAGLTWRKRTPLSARQRNCVARIVHKCNMSSTSKFEEAKNLIPGRVAKDTDALVLHLLAGRCSAHRTRPQHCRTRRRKRSTEGPQATGSGCKRAEIETGAP